MTPQVLKNIDKLELDYLVAIGGDDTLSYAAHLDRQGVKVIAVPKTMDNDVRNTEYCIGFSTAITRATDAIDRQRTTVGSHERIGVFRIFGRDAGLHRALHRLRDLHALLHPRVQGESGKLIDLLVERQSEATRATTRSSLLSEGAEWEGYQVQEYGRRRCVRSSQEDERRRGLLSDEIRNGPATKRSSAI